ncbi:MAG: GRP family sugar transporter [Bacteroidota bacterium]
MFIVKSYSLAIAMCIITMLCWGSWANTMKATQKKWAFQLFYWDYSLGVLLLSLLLAFTAGSFGDEGRPFLHDLSMAQWEYVCYAFFAGVIFNLSNVLLVTVIDLAGMAIAFPIGVGLALVVGVVVGYIGDPVGDAILIFSGLVGVVLAIILSGVSYGKIPSTGDKHVVKGILISVVVGLVMGLFYPLLVKSLTKDLVNPEMGKLTPYTAIVLFALGLFLSSFIWNTFLMRKPLVGTKVGFKEYFTLGTSKDHSMGILGGIIWIIGFSFMTLAQDQAGTAISYGLGQGATMVAAFWGVFIWKEFKTAPKSVNKLIVAMFLFYILGLSLLVLAKI